MGISNQILATRSLSEIREERTRKLPPHLRGKEFRNMSKSELFDYADAMGYQKSWVFIQLKLRAKRKW